MKAELNYPNLTKLRENVGLSIREFARQLEVHHTTVLKWEKIGRVLKSDYIPIAAEILGVTANELLGLPKNKSNSNQGGKLGKAFREVAELPRSQQQRILGMVEDMLIAQKTKAS